MKTVVFRSLDYTSYVKLAIVVHVASGCCVGVLSLLVALLGGRVITHLVVVDLQGILGGVVALFFVPLLFSALGLVVGIVSYLPFNWLLKQLGGLEITGEGDRGFAEWLEKVK